MMTSLTPADVLPCSADDQWRGGALGASSFALCVQHRSLRKTVIYWALSLGVVRRQPIKRARGALPLEL